MDNINNTLASKSNIGSLVHFDLLRLFLLLDGDSLSLLFCLGFVGRWEKGESDGMGGSRLHVEVYGNIFVFHISYVIYKYNFAASGDRSYGRAV